MKKYIWWVFTIFWMAVIFIFSSQNGIESHNTSLFLTEFIEKFFKDILTLNINTEMEYYIELILRKLAHLSEYFILAFLAYNAFLQTGIKKTRLVIYSLLFCFLYAITDEIHQVFVQGRGPSHVDVIIDTFGAFLYIILFKKSKFN